MFIHRLISHLSSPRNISLFDQNIVKSEMTELEMRKNDSLLLLLSFSYLCNMIWQKERKSKQNDGDNIDYPSIMLWEATPDEEWLIVRERVNIFPRKETKGDIEQPQQ